jgi:hypothetical protein
MYGKISKEEIDKLARYDSVRHPDRDREIKEYQQAHPELSMREIAEDFNHRWEMDRNFEMEKYKEEHSETFSQVSAHFSTPVQQISQGRVWQICKNWQPKKKVKEVK